MIATKGEFQDLDFLLTKEGRTHKPSLHRDSDPDLNPDWLRLHESTLNSNPDSDHLTRVDCDPDLNLELGPGDVSIHLLCLRPSHNFPNSSGVRDWIISDLCFRQSAYKGGGEGGGIKLRHMLTLKSKTKLQ